jgi:hypothetical protein
MSYCKGANNNTNDTNIARCEELRYDDETQQSNISYAVDCLKDDSNEHTLVHCIARSDDNDG